MTDSDDLKRRARELLAQATPNVGIAANHERIDWRAAYPLIGMVPALLARIEALEAELADANANRAGEHVVTMRVDLKEARARIEALEADRG